MKSKSQANRQTAQSGTIMVEYAIALPVFLMILFLGIESTRLAFASANLQNALNRGGRYATLGYHNNGDITGVDSVRAKIAELSGYTIDPQDFEICKAGTNVCNTRGTEGEWIQIRAAADIPVLLGIQTIKLSAGSLVKNEPNFALIEEPAPGLNRLSENPNIGQNIKMY